MRHLLDEGQGPLELFSRAPRALLALDFDGTLSPLVLVPASARIEPSAGAALERLLARDDCGLRIGVVSGRRLDDLRTRVPRTDFLVGLHGLEIEFAGEPARLRFDPRASDAALDRLRMHLRNGNLGEARIEDKRHAITVHVRGLDRADAETALEVFEDMVEQEIRAGAPLQRMRGHLSSEARPSLVGKHLAIADVLDRFETTTLAYAGDDATDEQVFEAFPKALCAVVMDPPRPSAARFWLRSPREIGALLERIAAIRSVE